MANKNIKVTRRDFLKSSTVASAAITLTPESVFSGFSSYDPKGLPTRTLGKTGERVPIMAYGTGSRFMAVDTDTGLGLLEHALDNGLYYWDTAASYGSEQEYSEERIGRLLKTKRKEVFLATKVQKRNADEAKRTVETSLKRLQTDYIDLYQVHSIQELDDARNLKDVVEVLQDYKRQGVIRHIGFTGHTNAEAMTYVANNYDLETMLIAMNHMQENQRFEQMAIPAAAKKNMGVIGMKVIRPRETVNGLDPKDLIKYTLSLDHVSAANVSMDSYEVINTNLDILRNFNPLPSSEMKKIRGNLDPFFKSPDIPWMQPGYKDGYFA